MRIFDSTDRKSNLRRPDRQTLLGDSLQARPHPAIEYKKASSFYTQSLDLFPWLHPAKMIFGSKALAVAVLGSLVFIGEASASKLKGDNKGLRKAMEVAAVDNMASDGSVDPDAVAPPCGDVGVSILYF